MPTQVDPLEQSGGNKLNALVDRLVGASEGLKAAIKNVSAQREAFLVAEQNEDLEGMRSCLAQFQKEMSKFFDERAKMGKAGDKREIEEIENKMLDMKDEMNKAITTMRESGGGEGTMYIPLRDQPAERPRLVRKPIAQPQPQTSPESARREAPVVEKLNGHDMVLEILGKKFQEILSSARSRNIQSRATGAGFSPFAAAESAAEALYEALQSQAAKESDHFRDDLVTKFRKFASECDDLSPGSGFGDVIKAEVAKPKYGNIKL